jgi:transposase
MRFIELDKVSVKELNRVYRTHPKAYVRQRAHCILLSNKSFTVPQLARIFDTRTHTVRTWFDRWQNEGIDGLQIKAGRGLKPVIDITDIEVVNCIKQEIQLNPCNLQQAILRINSILNTSFTYRQIKTFVKKTQLQLASLP